MMGMQQIALSTLSRALKTCGITKRQQSDDQLQCAVVSTGAGFLTLTRPTGDLTRLLISMQISHSRELSIEQQYWASPEQHTELMAMLAPYAASVPGWLHARVDKDTQAAASSRLVATEEALSPNPYRALTANHAIYEVLSTAVYPLSNQQLTNKILAQGLHKTSAQRPHACFSRATLAMKREGTIERHECAGKWAVTGQFVSQNTTASALSSAHESGEGIDPARAMGPCVYLIQDTATGAVKIGHARNASARIADLQANTPHLLRLIAFQQTSHRRSLEKVCHQKLKAIPGAYLRGEWFDGQAVESHILTHMRAAVNEMDLVERLAPQGMSAPVVLDSATQP